MRDSISKGRNFIRNSLSRAASTLACSTFPMRQLILDLLPEVPPRLDNFVAGGNGEMLTGLAAWLAPDCSEASLFLWGEKGSGKTHGSPARSRQQKHSALQHCLLRQSYRGEARLPAINQG